MLSKNISFVCLSVIVIALSACGGSDNKNPNNGKSSSSKAVSSSSKANSSVSSSKANSSIAVSSSSKSSSSSKAGASTFNINFGLDSNNWRVGFADYPKGGEAFYELNSEQTALPVELSKNLRGLKISGNNHSSDLFMFATGKVTGLEANRRYDLLFDLTFATKVSKNCVGVGGSPSESVTVKAGAASIEPKAELKSSDNQYSMNIDKGNQSVSGSDAIALGNIANDGECDNNALHATKTLNNQNTSFSATTDAEGSLWVMFSTDSGYAGATTIYFMNATITATPR